MLGDLAHESNLLAALLELHVDRVVDLGEIGRGELCIEGRSDDLKNFAGRSHGGRAP